MKKFLCSTVGWHLGGMSLQWNFFQGLMQILVTSQHRQGFQGLIGKQGLEVGVGTFFFYVCLLLHTSKWNVQCWLIKMSTLLWSSQVEPLVKAIYFSGLFTVLPMHRKSWTVDYHLLISYVAFLFPVKYWIPDVFSFFRAHAQWWGSCEKGIVWLGEWRVNVEILRGQLCFQDITCKGLWVGDHFLCRRGDWFW